MIIVRVVIVFITRVARAKAGIVNEEIVAVFNFIVGNETVKHKCDAVPRRALSQQAKRIPRTQGEAGHEL